MAAPELPDKTDDEKRLLGSWLTIKGSNRPGTAKEPFRRLREKGHEERIARYAAMVAAGQRLFE